MAVILDETGFQRARRRIISGLVLIVPIAATVFVAQFLFNFVEGIVGPVVDRIFYDNPYWREKIANRIEPIPGIKLGLTILMSLVLLYLAGFISTTFALRRLYHFGETLVLRIPLLNSIYGLTKQIIDLVANQENNAFKEIALFEYPRPGSYSLGFITGEVIIDDGRLMVNVLLPTTPIPSQLFLMLIPVEQVRVVDITIEDGLKFVMSGGVVSPGQLSTRPYLEAKEMKQSIIMETIKFAP